MMDTEDKLLCKLLLRRQVAAAMIVLITAKLLVASMDAAVTIATIIVAKWKM